MILILGHKGNMGGRYAAILNYLGVPWVGADKEQSPDEILALALSSTGVIIASPTACHPEHLMMMARLEIPVLCEKPFTKDMQELDEILKLYESTECLSMVLQYYELINPDLEGPSKYNYFKHGGDGIVWDCIQIIGLSTGDVTIEETSPIWECTLNGQELSIKDMDDAYIRNVQRWLNGDYLSLETIHGIHKKTHDFEKRFTFAEGRHRNSSTVHVTKIS